MRFDNFKTELPGTDARTATCSRRPATSRSRRRTTSTGRTSPTAAGSSYDVVGNGKTAVKVTFNKYLLGQTLNGIGRDPNPVLARHAATANRSWTEPTATTFRSATC